MAVAVTLVLAAPNTLRYLLDDDGAGDTTISNATLLADAQSAIGAGGLPLAEILKTTVADQAGARHLLLGDATSNAPNNANLARCQVTLTPRATGPGGVQISVDADVVAGEVVLVVQSSGDELPEAYLDLHYEHSYDDGPDGTGA